MSDPIISPGEAGGIFAGALALLVAIGHGLRWLLGWSDRRGNARTDGLNRWQAELDQWHVELGDREKTLDTRVKHRLELLEKQVPELIDEQHNLRAMVDRWRAAFRLVASELVAIAPDSITLLHAQAILAEDWPLDHATPPGMTAMADRLDSKGGGA